MNKEKAMEKLSLKENIFYGLIPRGKKHGDYFMEWAAGEKELKFYPDGEHVCANYLDEVFHGVHASTKERNPRYEQ